MSLCLRSLDAIPYCPYCRNRIKLWNDPYKRFEATQNVQEPSVYPYYYCTGHSYLVHRLHSRLLIPSTRVLFLCDTCLELHAETQQHSTD